MAEEKKHSKATSPFKTSYYPKFTVKNVENPSRILNIPIVGPIIRFILLIPVILYMIVLSIVSLFFWIIVPFVILFTGKYWDRAFDFFVGFLKLNTKVYLYLYGLTDKYPGFHMSDDGLFELSIEKPAHPNKLLSFPALGLVFRLIILIPYIIFENVIAYGSYVAYFLATFVILFKKKYPESFYEFVRDYIRVTTALSLNVSYISDAYPSFKISMNHKKVKIFLIIAGAILFLLNSGPIEPSSQEQTPAPMYDSTQDSTDTFSDF